MKKPRIELIHTWVTDIPLRTVRQRLIPFLHHHGMKAIRATDDEIIVKQGSQLATRSVGGWAVDPSSLPKRARIRFFAAEGAGTQIDVAIKETLGLGWLDPILKDRYVDYFRTWVGSLLHTFPPILEEEGEESAEELPTGSEPDSRAGAPTAVTCPECGSQGRPGARFCAHCGLQL